jgi:membrane protease subunit HflC
MRFFFALVVIGAIAVGSLWAAQFDQGFLVINREYQYRIILRLGRPIAEMTEAGPYRGVRIPFIDEVQVFDKRLQYLNAAANEIEIKNNERLIVDYFIVWQIESPLDFRRSFPGGIDSAGELIQQRAGSLVGAAIGNLSMTELLGRSRALESLSRDATEQLKGDGVRVVDVRINRTELPLKSENATFEQMREQRRAISREKRAIGAREAREIRAKADREARELLAAARADSELLRGEGDAQSARIYAAAYNKDAEFYAFVRSLEAYRKALGNNTTFVAPPDHEFFRYLNLTPSQPAR